MASKVPPSTHLDDHGLAVQMLKTGRVVGYFVYEDEFQIVAEPFGDRY